MHVPETGKNIFLSICSGCVSGIAFLPADTGISILFGFVPLLLLEKHRGTTMKKKHPFYIIFPAFLTWNSIALYWICFGSVIGGIAIIFLNSSFMAICFLFFSRVKQHFKSTNGGFIFIIFWIAFEFLHQHWELAFPWLTLGIVPVKNIILIQWYEYTGIAGGSLWILIINVLIFNIIDTILYTGSRNNNKIKLVWMFPVLVLAISFPVLISIEMENNYTDSGEKMNAVIIQPNINSYSEKFDKMSPNQQLEILLQLANDKADSLTDFIICPETSYPGVINEDSLNNSFPVLQIQRFLNRFPKTNFILGAITKKTEQYETRYYNTAVMISPDTCQLYRKTILLPGVEKAPFYRYFPWIENATIDFGGYRGSLQIPGEQPVFNCKTQPLDIATLICWESVFGAYAVKQTKKFANFFVVITNDGWWGDSPGYKQHVLFSRARAIENRRAVVRAANNGISCFINQKGQIEQSSQYDEKVAISGNFSTNRQLTFYTKYGDYIGYIALITSGLILIVILLRLFRNN